MERRNSIPIIYVRGNHYEVGFDIGRTFKSMIQSYIDSHGPLNKIYLPLYEKPEGKKSYELTLKAVEKHFPQYLDEIKGTADGADVPFHKLFLLHMDEILPSSLEKSSCSWSSGCTTICWNKPGQEILGHNEDALSETLNHFYFVSAHIKTDQSKGKWQIKEEKFTSLCYAGHLPGFTMSYNHHGLVYSINVIRVKQMWSGKTPRSILTRALLAAENLGEVKKILVDSGVGIGDGINANLIFLKDKIPRVFYNIEVGPSEPSENNSLIDIATIDSEEHMYHCNRYLRLTVPEASGLLADSSDHRHKVMDSLPQPRCCNDVSCLLGDESDKKHPVYRNEPIVKTIATGIFDLGKMTWSIYTDNPKTNDPIIQLPILI